MDSIGKVVADAAAHIAENQTGLVVLRVLHALADRAQANRSPFITVHDVLEVATQLAVQLDARIAEQLAERASKEGS